MELITAERDYVITQANRLFLFLIILILFTHKISLASTTDDKTLITDHFAINFNAENSAYTFAIAARLEAYNGVITSFFETDFLERVNVFISNSKSKYISDNESGSIYIAADENFFDTEKKIYEDLFFIYLEKLMYGRDGLNRIGKNFIKVLASFPKMEQEHFNAILSDLINESLTSPINIENLDSYHEAIQQEIYTALTYFIISDYGKKIFIQSLKDAEYYNGFFKSLSSITGEGRDKISERFNLFLKKSSNDISYIKNRGRLLIESDDKFFDVSFSIIGEREIAILQHDNEQYRFLIKSGDEMKVIPLKQSEQGSYFNNIVSIGNNLIVVTEIVKSGSKIYLFDIIKNDFTDSLLIPLLFIREINPINNEALIFSAYCGLNSDIYTFNIKSREVKVITESGNNSHPVMFGNKIYYISLYKGVTRIFVEDYD